jgi:hypothetical protein
MKGFTPMRTLLMAGAIIATAQIASAQIRDAGSKIRGDYMPGDTVRSSYRSIQHARDYAYDYRAYVQEQRQNKQPISAAVAKEHAEGIGHNIALTQKHLAEMRKHAAGDKETLAAIDSIDTHLKNASKHQAEMLEGCKGEVAADGTMKCCGDVAEDLDKAVAEHDKLMKKLAAKKAGSAK